MADRSGLGHGQVRLTCDDPPADVLAMMGEESPRLTGGIGGWDVTERPRQVSMTTWGGVEPFALDLPLILDRYASRGSVEPELAALLAVGRGDGESEPGVLEVAGIALPTDRWVLDGIDFGEALLLAQTGERSRQLLTLQLREYVPPEYLQLRAGALKASKGKTKVITTRAGDTPAKVAHRYATTFARLRELNTGLVKKAGQALRIGTRLRVPVTRSKARKPATRRGTH
jgi:hypothetical protein